MSDADRNLEFAVSRARELEALNTRLREELAVTRGWLRTLHDWGHGSDAPPLAKADWKGAGYFLADEPGH